MFAATYFIRQLLLVLKYIHRCGVHYVHPKRCTKCTPWEFCLATGLVNIWKDKPCHRSSLLWCHWETNNVCEVSQQPTEIYNSYIFTLKGSLNYLIGVCCEAWSRHKKVHPSQLLSWVEVGLKGCLLGSVPVTPILVISNLDFGGAEPRGILYLGQIPDLAWA